MTSCISRSGAIWTTGDTKSRKRVDDAIYSAIGNKENLNGYPLAISQIIVDYLEEYRSFGERDWMRFCKKVDPAPPIPLDFYDIWYGPCPIYPEKKISETHMLVYIPATVDGKPFTLKKLGEITKNFFPKIDKGYRHISSDVVHILGDKSIKSCWVLMTKDVLPGSRNKSYTEQQKIVASLAKISLRYEVPDTLEAATCILAQYFFDSKTCLFSEEPWTHTRCKDEVQSHRIVVGGFSPLGLYIRTPPFDSGEYGVAALFKF